MPTVNLSPKVRLSLYLVAAVGTIVAGYLFNKGYIGREEVALWGGFVALANGLAALNVPTAPRGEGGYISVARSGEATMRRLSADLNRLERAVERGARGGTKGNDDSGHVDLAVVLLVGIAVVLVLVLAGRV